jgi:integrase/recombinase XerD
VSLAAEFSVLPQVQRLATGVADLDDVARSRDSRVPAGEPVTGAGVNAEGVFDRLAKQLRFPVRPHMLRHTAAERWRRQRVASDVRQRLLGHVSAASMQPYMHPTDEEKRAAIERAAAHLHPSAQAL